MTSAFGGQHSIQLSYGCIGWETSAWARARKGCKKEGPGAAQAFFKHLPNRGRLN